MYKNLCETPACSHACYNMFLRVSEFTGCLTMVVSWY